jgi:LDH2 family malate/lactate/ureidoglycolate dehydrogenase
MSSDATRFDPTALLDFTALAFERCGLLPEHARLYADNLIFADLRGIASHGVSRVHVYVDRLRDGVVNARPKVRIETPAPAVALVDGDNAPGPVVGVAAMDAAIAAAKSAGVGVAVARNSNHYGCASYFAVRALDHDCIGGTASNAGLTMAVWGTKVPTVGTNPFAVAVPTGRYAPFVVDMATALVARGKIILAAKAGKSIPEGWALDTEGRPTTDAQAALDGVVLPFAGPKGSAISLLVDIVSGVLSGASFGPFVKTVYEDPHNPQDTGHFFLAMDVARFMPVDAFKKRMDTAIEALKGAERAAGFDEVLMPGEPELRSEAAQREKGIAVPPAVVKELRVVAERLDIAFPEAKG